MTGPSFPSPHTNFRIGTPGYTRASRPTAEDNVPPRFELFLLGEGEKKVTEEADTRKFGILSFPKQRIMLLYMNLVITTNDFQDL